MRLIDALHQKSASPAVKLLGVGLLGSALAGCSLGEDLSGQPFIMSCSGENIVEQDDINISSPRSNPQLAETLAGLRMPNHVALQEALPHSRSQIDSEYGFTRDETPLDGNVAKLPLAGGPGLMLYRDTGDLTRPPSGFDSFRFQSPVGEIQIEHYYLTRGGELKEVEGFHMASVHTPNRSGTTVMMRDMAAALPNDAAYAVYYVEASSVPYSHPLDGDVPGMTGKPGFWVLPLSESQRYQPYGDDPRQRSVPGERPLGPYVGTQSSISIADGAPARSGDKSVGHEPHRRADKEVETVPCFIKPGSAMQIAELYDVEAGPDENGHLAPVSGKGAWRTARGNDYGMYFVGGREALSDLPSDPEDFSG